METPVRDHDGAGSGTTHAPIVVTLVHGTFAKGAPWTRDGSILRKQIAAALADERQDVVFGTFDWSGRNTHRARIKAGYELADHIRKLRATCPDHKHFIVAHSHGGNVALLAHKHLPADLHATGIATLGTPFLYARMEGLDGLDEKKLREDLEKSEIFKMISWPIAVLAGVLTFVFSEPAMTSIGYGDEGWRALLGLMVAGLLFDVLPRAMNHLLFPLSPRVAAWKIARALALAPLPRTHVLSFIYPRDEAGFVLNALEKTTALPSKAIRWLRGIAGTAFTIFMVLLVISIWFSGPISGVTGVEAAVIEEKVTLGLTFVFGIGISIWMYLVAIRYVLSFLRGHPAGFGWERPSMHAHVDIGADPEPEGLAARSYAHQEVPFTAADDAAKGLRHSGLYEDNRILRALAYWMAHVR